MSKYCQHCGAEVQDNSVFCENCGKNLSDTAVEKQEPQKGEKRCKTCGEIHSKKLKSCPNCGVKSRQLVAAKLTNCKGCGHSIAVNAVKCPSCGRKTHYNLKITTLVLGIFAFFIIVVSALVSSGGDTPSDPNAAAVNTEQPNNIIYSDNFFDIEYMKLSDVPAVTACSLQLKVTNKSDKKLTLLLDDVYINDIAIQSGTGMPITLEPGKISQSPFVLFSGNTGLSAEDITKVEFKLTSLNDNLQRVHTTSKITIAK